MCVFSSVEVYFFKVFVVVAPCKQCLVHSNSLLFMVSGGLRVATIVFGLFHLLILLSCVSFVIRALLILLLVNSAIIILKQRRVIREQCLARHNAVRLLRRARLALAALSRLLCCESFLELALLLLRLFSLPFLETFKSHGCQALSREFGTFLLDLLLDCQLNLVV